MMQFIAKLSNRDIGLQLHTLVVSAEPPRRHVKFRALQSLGEIMARKEESENHAENDADNEAHGVKEIK